MKMVSCEMPDTLLSQLERACDLSGLSRSEMIRECIRDGIPHYLGKESGSIDISMVRDTFNKVLHKLEGNQ